MKLKKRYLIVFIIMVITVLSQVAFVNGYEIPIQSAPCVHKYSVWTVSKKATCTQAGQETQKCLKCGRKNTRNIKATGHFWQCTGTIKPANCKQDGEAGYKCRNCGAKKIEKFYAREFHDYTKRATIKAATCTGGGSGAWYCGRCNYRGSVYSIPALGHNWSGWKISKNATCISPGTKVNTCLRCKTKQTLTIAKKSHSFTSWAKTGSKKKVGSKYQYEYRRTCTAGCKKVESKWQ